MKMTIKLLWPIKHPDKDTVMIPVWEGSRYATFTWKEDESVIDFMARHNDHENVIYTSFRFVYDEDDYKYVDMMSDEYDAIVKNGLPFVCVYEVTDLNNEEFYLVTNGELNSYEELEQAVCLPRHRLNIQLFMDWYMRTYVPFDVDLIHAYKRT